MTPAHFYVYIFFRSPSELLTKKEENPQVTSFFEQLKRYYALESKDNFYSGENLTMLRLAQNQEISVCVYKFHDLDIFEIEWDSSEDAFEFWEKRLNDLEKHFADIPSCFGIASALSVNPENLAAEKVKIVSKYAVADVHSVGKFYNIKANHYVLIAKDETVDTTDFLDRHFPVIFSFLRKIEFEDEELRKIRADIDKGKEQINNFFQTENPEDIEDVLQMKKDVSYFQKNITLLAKLKQTLDINILNLEKYCNKYQIENDKIFSPFLKNAKHLCQQTEYDLNYARLTLEAFDSHVQFLDLIVKNRSEKSQKRIERLIALLIIPIGIGQIGAALGWEWKEVLFFIFSSMAVIFLISDYKKLPELPKIFRKALDTLKQIYSQIKRS